MHELTVQFLDYLRVVKHDLGDERPGLQVAPPLTLEKVAFGAHERAMRQRIEQIRHAILQDRLARGPGSRQAGGHSEQRAALRRMTLRLRRLA